MATSNITYQTSTTPTPTPTPTPSSNEEVPVVRKVKKIKTGLSNILSILNAMSETCESIDNDTSKINVIQKNLADDCIGVDKVTVETEENSICKGDSSCEDNEKCGYYYRNRDKKLEYQKKYNREQGDKIKNYNKDYYQKRREEILEKAKTKVMCECGCEVQLFNMNSHKKTKKHARALEQRKKEQ